MAREDKRAPTRTRAKEDSKYEEQRNYFEAVLLPLLSLSFGEDAVQALDFLALIGQ